MPRLRETKVKGIALVKHPANRRPFLLRKSAGEGTTMSETVLNAPSSEVRAAIEAVGLSKSDMSQDARESLEAIGLLVHATGGLSLDDVLEVAKAAGAAEVEKAKKDMPKFIKDKMDAKDDEDEEDEDEEEDEEESDADKEGDWSENKSPKSSKSTKKSAAPATANQGEAMPAEVEKSERVELAKALDVLRTKLAKTEKELAVERDIRLTKSISEELGQALPNLAIDKEALTSIVKSMRSEGADKASHDSLMTMLKAADAQVAAAQASGGSITRPVSKTGAAGHSGAKEKERQIVEAHIAKSGRKMTYYQGFNELLANPTPEFEALNDEYAQERN